MDSILPNILAFVTGKARYKPEILWSSNSFVHNIFRLYESIFWRKVGVRVELSSYSYEGGTLYLCHTFESMCALLETKIREFKLPKVSLVKIPVLQSVEGFNIPNAFPYKLAIAFDAVSSADGGIAVTNTYSHTCTGSNLTLTTGAVFTQAPTPTGSATYNSVAMSTGVTNTAIGNTNMYIFYLANPATGANNVVTTGSASCRNYGGSISMTGTNVGSPVGASANANGTSTTPSVSVTTSFANSMLVNTVFINDTVAAQTPSATGTNQTSRYQLTHASGGVANLGSTQTSTSTGSYTSSWSITGSIIWGSSILEVRELSTTVASRLTLLGVS